MLEEFSQWIYDTVGIGHSFQYKALATVITVLIVLLFRKLLLYFFRKRIKHTKTRYSWEKSSSYVSYFIIIIILVPVWLQELHAFGTFFGLVAAGIAIVLKEPISNFFGWIYIMIKKPFDMGDRIQIGNTEGDILDIGFLDFTLLEIKNWVEADQSTGRIVHVPNGLVFTTPVMNYNEAMDFIWNEIPITITFESDWKKAKEILMKIEEEKLKPLADEVRPQFEKAHRKYYVEYHNLTPIVYTRIKQNGVQLTLRYLCPPKMRRGYEQVAMEAVLEEFAMHPDIQFAYPTTRFYQGSELPSG